MNDLFVCIGILAVGIVFLCIVDTSVTWFKSVNRLRERFDAAVKTGNQRHGRLIGYSNEQDKYATRLRDELDKCRAQLDNLTKDRYADKQPAKK